jgi:hypothetical protein
VEDQGGKRRKGKENDTNDRRGTNNPASDLPRGKLVTTRSRTKRTSQAEKRLALPVARALFETRMENAMRLRIALIAACAGALALTQAEFTQAAPVPINCESTRADCRANCEGICGMPGTTSGGGMCVHDGVPGPALPMYLNCLTGCESAFKKCKRRMAPASKIVPEKR